MQKTDDMMEIDLKEILMALLSKAWLIALCGIVLAVGGFIFSKYFMTPIYCSTAKIYVMTQSTDKGTVYNDVVMSTYLSKDYLYLVKSRDVLEKVIKECDLKDSYGSLAGRIRVENLTDTRILSIAVYDEDPKMAQTVAKQVCSTAGEHLESVMNLEAVNIAEKANLPVAPSSPNVMKWTVMGMLIGGFICASIVVLMVLLDDTIKSQEDVERYLGLSTLAMIPVTAEEEETDKADTSTENAQEDISKAEPEAPEGKEDAAPVKKEVTEEAAKKEEA